MMGRKFTNREKALLLVLALLLLACGYYILVAQPTAAAIDSAEARLAEAEDLSVVEEARAANMQKMRDAIVNLGADSKITELAAFDNMQNVVRLLNSTLAGSENYNLIFSPVAIDGHLARRTIDMSFDCAGYAAAKTVVKSLYAAPYRSWITGLSIMTGDGESSSISAGSVSVKLTVTFFEYVENAAEPAK